MAEGLLSGIEAPGSVLYGSILDDSIGRCFASCGTAEIDVAFRCRRSAYMAIIPVCGEVLAIASCPCISEEVAAIAIAADILPIKILFVVDGVILEDQIDVLYGEIGILSDIGPRLDIVFEPDHPHIDVDDRYQQQKEACDGYDHFEESKCFLFHALILG